MPHDDVDRPSLRRRMFPDPVSGLYAGTLLLAPVFFFAVQGLTARRMDIDRALYDTYYVIVPARQSLPVAAALAIYLLAFRFFRPIVGVPYRRWLAILQWVCTALGAGLLFFPQMFAACAGQPAHPADYAALLSGLHGIASAGYLLSLLSPCLFVICLADGLYRRVRGPHSPAS